MDQNRQEPISIVAFDITGKITALRIWMKAFIPSDLEGVEPVPVGEHAGKLMLKSPEPFKTCFLIDQRNFSSDINASARVHSQIDIDTQRGTLIEQHHYCCESIEIDCADGTEKCREAGDNSQMQFSDFEVSDGGKKITVTLQGSAKNPCFSVAGIKLSPNLDYEGILTITLDETRQRATVGFEGNIETYPAFEMYVSANGGAPHTLFQHPALPGTSPIDLAGGPQREIKHEVTVTL